MLSGYSGACCVPRFRRQRFRPKEEIFVSELRIISGEGVVKSGGRPKSIRRECCAAGRSIVGGPAVNSENFPPQIHNKPAPGAEQGKVARRVVGEDNKLGVGTRTGNHSTIQGREPRESRRLVSRVVQLRKFSCEYTRVFHQSGKARFRATQQ